MPRAIRNWWIETKVDGSDKAQATGPQAADGGFRTVIKQRQKGDIVTPFIVEGRVNVHGQLILTVTDGQTGREIRAFASER